MDARSSLPLDVGIFRTTLLPNLIFHTTLALPTYFLARSTNYLEAKDLLWSSGQVANAWYASIGRRVLFADVPLRLALRSLSKPGYLVLSGVTLWGARLFYRVASRALRRGSDDARYTNAKTADGFWNRALFTLFLPEALAQAVISLPFTAPFTHVGPVLICPRELGMWLEALAIGMWSMGMALEVIADSQLESHKQSGDVGLCTKGVWSIVRHPKSVNEASP